MTRLIERIRRRHLVAFAIGIILVSLTTGTAAHAYWTAQARGTGAVTTTSVAITQTDFPALTTTYVNTLTRLQSTGSFVITNTGQTAGTVTASIAGAGSLGPLLPVRIWPVVNAAACTASSTPPSSATTGTWASVTVTGGTPLAAGASQRFCVRTVVADASTLAATTGARDVTATLTASLGGTGWANASTTAATTHRSVAIYPASAVPASTSDAHWYTMRPAGASNLCADVMYNGTGAGSYVISYSCFDNSSTRPNSNRAWQFVPLDASKQVVALRPAHSGEMRLSTDTTGGAILAASNTTDAKQAWIVQARGSGQYQLVSKATGQCLVFPTSNNRRLTLADCDQAKTGITLPATLPTVTASSASAFTVDVGWYLAGGYSQQVEMLSGGSWVSCRTSGTASVSGSTVECQRPTTGAGTLRLVSGDQVMYQFTINRTASGSTVTTTITGVTAP